MAMHVRGGAAERVVGSRHRRRVAAVRMGTMVRFTHRDWPLLFVRWTLHGLDRHWSWHSKLFDAVQAIGCRRCIFGLVPPLAWDTGSLLAARYGQQHALYWPPRCTLCCGLCDRELMGLVAPHVVM